LEPAMQALSQRLLRRLHQPSCERSELLQIVHE
jgi:hypothetical protein